MKDFQDLIFKVVALVATTVNAVEDGKITVKESLQIGAKALPLRFINWKQVKAQFKSLTPDQGAALFHAVADEFDIAADRAEKVVKSSLNIFGEVLEIKAALEE